MPHRTETEDSILRVNGEIEGRKHHGSLQNCMVVTEEFISSLYREIGAKF
jgi:hypothetical protein